MTASPHASTLTAKMGCGPSFEFVRISNWVISGVFTISLSYCALHMRDASGGSDAKSFLGNFKLVFIVCCMAFVSDTVRDLGLCTRTDDCSAACDVYRTMIRSSIC